MLPTAGGLRKKFRSMDCCQAELASLGQRACQSTICPNWINPYKIPSLRRLNMLPWRTARPDGTHGTRLAAESIWAGDSTHFQGDKMRTVRAQRASPHPLARHARAGSMVGLELSAGLMKARADTFSLYLKIKRSHRYLSDPRFRQYRTLLQAHAEELVAASHGLDVQLRHLRGNGAGSVELGMNVHSSNEDDVEYVTPEDLLAQLRVDNQILVGSLRSAQALCQGSGDIVTESLIDVWIDEARRRAAVLMDATWGD
jgi:starvation-inducible DNA-binding protein